MVGLFANIRNKIRDTLSSSEEDDLIKESDKEYVEIDSSVKQEGAGKMIVRPFVLDDFSDIKPILDVLREGSTICLINIKPLKEKDIVELKRSINKLKKTADAISGDIAGFGDDYIVITPESARIYRTKETSKVEESDVPQDKEE